MSERKYTVAGIRHHHDADEHLLVQEFPPEVRDMAAWFNYITHEERGFLLDRIEKLERKT
jgi:hypothetical protein